MATIDDSIEAAKKRLKQLQARKQMQDAAKRARASKAERANDTRRKVLVGAMVLGLMEANAEFDKQMTLALDSYLTRPDDRALFALPAKEPQP